jgi:hypothetical protein
MAEKLPISSIELSSWNWWISDDRFVGIQNSLQDISWLEIRKFPKSIKLWYALVKDSWTTVTDQINCALTTSAGIPMFFWNTWKIYAILSWVWTNIYTHTSNPAILWCAEYNGYIYRATSTKLHRVAVGSVVNPLIPSLDWWTFTEWNTANHPMISTNLYLYIGDWKYVATVQDTVFNATTLTLPSNESVYQMTINWVSTRIYTRLWGNDWWRCYYWDWTSKQIDQVQELTWIINNAWTKESVDYVIMWNEPILYYYPYQKQILKKINNLSSYPNSMICYRNYLLFWRTGWVYSWWALNKDYAEVLNMEYKTSNGNATDDITCILNSNWTLYVAWKNGTSYGVDKLSTTTYASTWYFTTRVFYGNVIWKYKYGIEWYLVHTPLVTGQTIQIYEQTDLTWWYVLKQTITWPTTTGLTKVKLNWKFLMSELKIVLNWPGTSTPEIFDVYFRLEEWQ